MQQPTFHGLPLELLKKNKNPNLLRLEYEVKNILPQQLGKIHCITILPNRNVMSGSSHGELHEWNINTGQCVKVLDGHYPTVITSIAILQNGNIMSGTYSGRSEWDKNTGKCLNKISDQIGYLLMAILPSGNVVSGCNHCEGSNDDKNTLKEWDKVMVKCLKTYYGHTGELACLTVLPNGNPISGSADKTLKIWDKNTGECLKTLSGHNHTVRCVRILPNGNILSGSFDKSLKEWEKDTGKCLRTLHGHSDFVNCIDILPNGNFISGSADATLKEWDKDTGECLKTLSGHSDAVNCVAVLNGFLISGSTDGTIRVWESPYVKISLAEIRKNSRLLSQSIRTKTGFFFSLPIEINQKISALTGNSKIHAEEEATQIAKPYFCNPL